ncbi:hypothetical protein Bbelb_257270 [Branchiostoma belcheri]|nr:hypothetical protein Bbelb_257270 [Branchiostoma belcheri]
MAALRPLGTASLYTSLQLGKVDVSPAAAEQAAIDLYWLRTTPRCSKRITVILCWKPGETSSDTTHSLHPFDHSLTAIRTNRLLLGGVSLDVCLSMEVSMSVLTIGETDGPLSPPFSDTRWVVPPDCLSPWLLKTTITIAQRPFPAARDKHRPSSISPRHSTQTF